MRRLWSIEELGEHWTLLPADLTLLADLPDTGKLGFAAQLAYWRQQGRFPDEVGPDAQDCVSAPVMLTDLCRRSTVDARDGSHLGNLG